MAAADDLSAPRLVVTAPAPLAGRVLRLSPPEAVIGHSEAADLVLEHKFVSRRQALVTVDESGVVTIHDLDSAAGTVINAERIAAPRVLEAGVSAESRTRRVTRRSRSAQRRARSRLRSTSARTQQRKGRPAWASHRATKGAWGWRSEPVW